MKRVLFLLLFFIFQGGLEAQTTQEKSSDFSYVLADISYSSDAVFMGRRDSIEAPYLQPSIGYYDKSGFFGSAAGSYLTASGEGRFDLFLLSAGYLHTGNKWSAGISGAAYFFNEDSYNVQSELDGSLLALLGYDFDVVELTFTGATYFGGDSADFAVMTKLDRTFYAMDRSLVITPTFMVGAGTQYFYEEYYNTSRLGNRKGGGNRSNMGDPGIMQSQMTSVSISEASEFHILNIEAQLPFHYFYKSFIFSFTPMLSFPQTPAQIITEDAVYEEDLDSVFYWSAGISYWFKTGN